MLSFCNIAPQGLEFCSERQWEIRTSNLNVVFVSLRLCCLRSSLWSALWLDSTLSDLKILSLQLQFSPVDPHGWWSVERFSSSVHFVHCDCAGLPKMLCIASTLQLQYLSRVCKPNKSVGVEDSTLERSANFLTFLHHKFSHFPINLSNFQIFKEVFQLS